MSCETWNDLASRHWAGTSLPAVVTTDGDWSGDELLARAAGAAAWFDRLGVPARASIPALVDESPTAVALAVGAAVSRRALAPLGTRLPAHDLVAAVQGIDAPLLLTTPDLLGLAQQVADLAGIELVVVDEPPAPARPVDRGCQPEDPAVIVHTSGTTGRPKPIVMDQGRLAARVMAYERVLGLGVGDRFCSASPFYHTAGVGMALTVLGMGSALIPQAWFSVGGWKEAGRLGMTGALLVPTMIDILLAQGALADATPRILQYGAAPIHPATLTEALATLPSTRFLQVFGQTEVSPVTFLDHDDHLRALAGRADLLGTVGRAVPHATVAVVDADANGIGEVRVRAAHSFAAGDDGWHRTGDLGELDGDGYLTLRGRLLDRIVRGGENIYPSEIELVLTEHPDVLESAVVGVADRRWGEIVKAVVVPADPESPPDADELRRHLGAHLAHFKVPAVIEFVADLPRNPNGKVLRRGLR